MRRFFRYFYPVFAVVAVQCFIVATFPEKRGWEDFRIPAFVLIAAALFVAQFVQWRSHVNFLRQVEDLRKRALIMERFQVWDHRL